MTADRASPDSPGSEVPPTPGNAQHCQFEALPPSSPSTKRCNHNHPAMVQLGPRPSLPSSSPHFPPGPGLASVWVGTIRPFLLVSAPPYSTPLLRLIQSELSLQVRPRPAHAPPTPRPAPAPSRGDLALATPPCVRRDRACLRTPPLPAPPLPGPAPSSLFPARLRRPHPATLAGTLSCSHGCDR